MPGISLRTVYTTLSDLVEMGELGTLCLGNGAMRFDGEAEWRSLLRAGLANSLGLFLIVLIQYVTFAATGTVYWTDGWLYVNLLFAVVPMMFVLPYFNRWFFRATGQIWLGPMVTCLIFVMVLISNTVFYLPL